MIWVLFAVAAWVALCATAATRTYAIPRGQGRTIAGAAGVTAVLLLAAGLYGLARQPRAIGPVVAQGDGERSGAASTRVFETEDATFARTFDGRRRRFNAERASFDRQLAVRRREFEEERREFDRTFERRRREHRQAFDDARARHRQMRDAWPSDAAQTDTSMMTWSLGGRSEPDGAVPTTTLVEP